MNDIHTTKKIRIEYPFYSENEIIVKDLAVFDNADIQSSNRNSRIFKILLVSTGIMLPLILSASVPQFKLISLFRFPPMKFLGPNSKGSLSVSLNNAEDFFDFALREPKSKPFLSRFVITIVGFFVTKKLAQELLWSPSESSELGYVIGFIIGWNIK